MSATTTSQNPYQEPYFVVVPTTSPIYATVEEMFIDIISYVIADQSLSYNLESEVSSKVVENIELEFTMENEQEGNTSANATTTAAEPQPFKTTYERSFFDEGYIFEVVIYSWDKTVEVLVYGNSVGEMYCTNSLKKLRCTSISCLFFLHKTC